MVNVPVWMAQSLQARGWMFKLLLCSCLVASLASCKSGDEPDPTETGSFRPVPGVTTRITETPTAPVRDLKCYAKGSKVYAVWVERRTGETTHDLWFGEAAHGNNLTTNAVRLTDTTEDDRLPTVAVTPQGDVAVVWQSGTLGQRSLNIVTRGNADSTFGTPGIIGQGDAQAGDDHVEAMAHYAESGELHVVWANKQAIFYRRQATIGGGLSTILELEGDSSVDASRPSVASYENDVFIVWEATQDVGGTNYRVIRAVSSRNKGATFDADVGTTPGSSTVLPLIANVDGYFKPEVAAYGATGRFLVAYRVASGLDSIIRVAEFSGYGGTFVRLTDVYRAVTEAADDPAIATQRTGTSTEVYVSFTRGGTAGGIGEIQLRASLDGGRSWGPYADFSDGAGGGVADVANLSSLTVAGNELYVGWLGQDGTSGQVMSFVRRSPISGRFD